MDAAAIVQLVSLGISALSAIAAAAAHYRINKNPMPPVSPPTPVPLPVPAPTPNDPVHPNHPVLQGLLQAIAILQRALAQQGTVPAPSVPART